MKTLRVSLGDRSYPIVVAHRGLAHTGSILQRSHLRRRHAVIVAQKGVARLYLETLSQSLLKGGFEPLPYILPDGRSSESSKTFANATRLIRFLASHDGEGRSLFVAALGGGVIGDLAGFAAAVYRRGIPFIQIPTTLTAQVDSAIGGKTGVDLPEGKNLLGTIYQPYAVVSDPETLQSLPERHWSDGFAEVIKYGVIADPRLFGRLESRGIDFFRTHPHDLESVISTCAQIKARLVEKDELDKKGFRMILNFGHTAGHGIEAAAGYAGRYTHGEAVAVGMLVACDLGEKLGILKDRGLTQRVEKILMKFRLPLYFKGIPTEGILKAIGYDKKSELGKNRFILPVSIGRTQIVRDVPAPMIRWALEKRRR